MCGLQRPLIVDCYQKGVTVCLGILPFTEAEEPGSLSAQFCYFRSQTTDFPISNYALSFERKLLAIYTFHTFEMPIKANNIYICDTYKNYEGTEIIK